MEHQQGLSLGRELPTSSTTAPTLPSCSEQLQEELENRIQAWEQEREEPFLVKGQQFMEYVTEQWQLYRMEKEKEKQERVSAELNVPSWLGTELSVRRAVPAQVRCQLLRAEGLSLLFSGSVCGHLLQTAGQVAACICVEPQLLQTCSVCTCPSPGTECWSRSSMTLCGQLCSAPLLRLVSIDLSHST